MPLRLSFAATAHKVQGQTVKKPNALAIDLRSVREAAQEYVILSRVQSLSQLFIIDDFPIEKIYSSSIAMSEHDRLKLVAINHKQDFDNFIVSCNVRSLRAHFEDLTSSSLIIGAQAICIQETWLLEEDGPEQFIIPGYLPILNSVKH